MKNYQLASILLLAFLFCCGPRSAQAEVKDVVVITADDNSRSEGNLIVYENNVICKFRDRTLTADHMTYDTLTHVMVATGHVLLVDGKNEVAGVRLTIPDFTASPLKLEAMGHNHSQLF